RVARRKAKVFYRTDLTPPLKLSAVDAGKFDAAENKFLEDVPENQVIQTPRKHDLLLTRANTPELVGDVCWVSKDFPNLIIPDLIYRLTVERAEAEERFIMYYLLSKVGRASIEAQARGSSGSMVKLGQGHLKDFQVVSPSLIEQRQIAAFLDWKTGQIDALIGKKKKLLEKLKEKRIAVITQAVTRGLNPAAPLRDSGIPWLGHVPQHWEVMKFGYRTNIQEGQVDPEAELYLDQPLIAPNHIESNTGRVSDVTSAHDQAAISGKYSVRKGDVVYSKIRPHLNKCALVDFDGLCSADMYPIRTEQELTPGFLHYWMLAQPFLDYATESSMRVAMPKLNRDTLSAAPLVVPPESEQKAIIAHVEAVTKRIDSLTVKVEAVIDRLIEYRSALITAATTGQIDVRKVKIPPPKG
ncbi:MAG: restriction endonuclease subunit S, partial [Verrucomicrobiota bacterium]